MRVSDLPVILSAQVYLRNYRSGLHQIFVDVTVTYGRGSILRLAALRYVVFFRLYGRRYIFRYAVIRYRYSCIE